MPTTIKHMKMNVKDGNQYKSIDTVSDGTTAERVAAVNSAGTTQIGLVGEAGTTQIGLVGEAGAAQVAAVGAKGAEVLESIPSDYTALAAEVGELNNEINGLPTEESGADLIAALMEDALLTEDALLVAGTILDRAPQESSGADLRDAISLEADRLTALYNIWLTEREGA